MSRAWRVVRTRWPGCVADGPPGAAPVAWALPWPPRPTATGRRRAGGCESSRTRRIEPPASAGAMTPRTCVRARWRSDLPPPMARHFTGGWALPLRWIHPVGDRAIWQRLEVAAGQPQVYAATSEEFVAQMLNLDALNAIAFDKGCYTGQEVIARAHYRGRVKRRMQRFRVARGLPCYRPGDSGQLADGRTFKVVLSRPAGRRAVRLSRGRAPGGCGRAGGAGADCRSNNGTHCRCDGGTYCRCGGCWPCRRPLPRTIRIASNRAAVASPAAPWPPSRPRCPIRCR